MITTEIKGKFSDNRISFLQYLNTTLITVALGFLLMLNTNITAVKHAQSIHAQDLVKLNTVQQINVENVKILDSRVKVLETASINDLKDWIDDNYVRKTQR